MAFDYVNLWDSQTPSWVEENVAGGGYQVSYGEGFTLSEDGYLQEITWYRTRTGSGGACLGLRVWRVSDQALIYSAYTVPDNGAIGWQTYTVGDAIPLVAGVAYRVTRNQNSGSYTARYSGPGTPLPAPPLAFETPSHSFRTGNYTIVFPGTAMPTTEWYGVGVSVTSRNPVTTPPPYPATPSDLASWLSAGGDNTHHDALPWLTKAAVDSTATNVSSILTSVGSGLASKVDDIKTSVGTGLKTAVDALTTTLGDVSSGMVQTLNTVSSTVATILNDASSGLVAVLNRLAGGGGALPARVALPGTGWSLRTSTTWQGELAWAEPADLYVIHVTTVPTKSNPQIVAGVQMYWRSGWWCILNGAETGQRNFLDFEWGEATWGGRRMPGILLYYGTGWEGTIDAWDYTAP